MIGFYSEDQYFWSVMILHSGDLKGGGEEGMKKRKLQLWTALNLYKI